ncbi:hypothetical protein CCACVL1_03103, partial [Corchorus capsularis]
VENWTCRVSSVRRLIRSLFTVSELTKSRELQNVVLAA